jgi:hypothetical protein
MKRLFVAVCTKCSGKPVVYNSSVDGHTLLDSRVVSDVAVGRVTKFGCFCLSTQKLSRK